MPALFLILLLCSASLPGHGPHALQADPVLPASPSPSHASAPKERLAPALSTTLVTPDCDPLAHTLQQGFQALHENRPRRALSYFQIVLTHDPRHPSAAYGQAVTFLKLRKHVEALDAIAVILDTAPEHVEALSLRGIALYHLERFDEAGAIFRHASSLDPDEGFFHEALAWCLLCEGNPAEAGHAALRAIQLYRNHHGDPSFSHILAYLGFRIANQSGEAKQTLRSAIEQLNPVAWPFPVLIFLSGHIDADALIVEVSSLPQETRARTYIALRLLFDQRHDEARRHLEWIDQEGDHQVFEHTLARVLLRRLDQRHSPTSPPRHAFSRSQP